MMIKEGTITVFEGPQRSGKTLAMSIFAYKGYLQKRPVITNLAYTFPYEQLRFFELDLKNEEVVNRVRGGVLTLDELNFWLDARSSMTGINKQFTTMLLQIKKLGVDLYATTHHISYLDKRFRENYDFLVKTSVYPEKREEGVPPQYVELNIENGPNQKYMKRKTRIHLAKNPGLLGLYDTTHVFDPFEQMGGKEDAKK